MRTCAVVLGAALLIGCSNPLAAPVNQEFELRFGQTATIAETDLQVGFVEVEDSRCPIDVRIVCVWAGDGAVHLTLAHGSAEPVVRVIHTTLEPQKTAIPPDDTFEIQLISLDPARTLGGEIPKRSYVAKLIVRAAQ
jgi:hypothetical protein